MAIYIGILILLLIGLILYFVSFRETTPDDELFHYDPVIIDIDNQEFEFFAIINEHRANLGLPLLLPERFLTDLAISHCSYMSEIMDASHDYVFERRDEVFKRGFTFFGEISGAGFNTPNSLFHGYLRSYKHRAAIEHPNFTHIGISFKKDLNFKNYNTIIFARK